MQHYLIAGILGLLLAHPLAANDWTRFRGPNGGGVAEGPAIPLEWSAEKNLKWKTELPGKGSSSPVVAAGQVYLTCYTGYGVDLVDVGKPGDLVRHLIAFDRTTGDEAWRASIASTAEEDPYVGFLTQHGYASSTPVVDGDRVFAILGKSGLFAFDLAGNQLWQVDLGQKSDPAKWGNAASPIVVGNVVIVDAGILGSRFLGLDKETGDQLWEIEDAALTNSWATPTVSEVDGQSTVLFHVPKQVIAVDPQTGEKLWSANSPVSDAACASIVVDQGVAYLMGGRAGRAVAIRCGGTGDVSGSHTVWEEKLRAGIGTPVAIDGRLYWSSGGIFYAADAASGNYVYRERLPRLGGPTGGFGNANYASPVAIDNAIIQFTRDGESYVIEAGDEFKLLAHNPGFSGDESAFSATPAISDGELFVRSEKFLYCIGE